MGYRQYEPRPPKPRRTMEKMATPSDIHLALGTTASLAIPCWYIEVRKPIPAHHHNRPHHDHVGWPNPDHHDHSCQAWDYAHACCSHDHNVHHCDPHCKNFIDMRKLIPVHLSEEGYHDVQVITEWMEGDNRVTLAGVGNIDPEDDWIVRISLESDTSRGANLSQPMDKAWFRLSVFVEGDNVLSNNYTRRNKRDLVCQAKVCVNPTAVED